MANRVQNVQVTGYSYRTLYNFKHAHVGWVNTRHFSFDAICCSTHCTTQPKNSSPDTHSNFVITCPPRNRLSTCISSNLHLMDVLLKCFSEVEHCHIQYCSISESVRSYPNLGFLTRSEFTAITYKLLYVEKSFLQHKE